MSLVRVAGGRVIDPANDIDAVGDVWLRDGRVIAEPGPDARADTTHDASGMVVMAGGVDLHSHLGGGKVNLARLMMAEDHRAHAEPGAGELRAGGGAATPSSFAAGYRYARMGYTAAFEPAMVPANARHTHLELADTPVVDSGCLAMLGNDDLFLDLVADQAPPAMLADYVAWTLRATQSLGIKVVNPGGIQAFKLGGRDLGFEQPSPHRGLTPRRILAALARAVHDAGVAHPLHVHCNDLGLPGNAETTLATLRASDGVPVHLTHLQFHSYGDAGRRWFSSRAGSLAEAVNASPHITVDVGQVMFGQTVTASGDTMAQYRNHALAHPRTWLCMDIECEAGCGVVPIRYSDKSYVNALQWAIGLELFLLVDDPWRIFLTTDHPNGAPFTTYPHLIRLLMDRAFRESAMETVNRHALAATDLRGLRREYTLSEIAIVTRAGPARSLGLADHGHLGAGAVGDVVLYRDQPDREAMFAAPELVLKDGVPVLRAGEQVALPAGATHVARLEHDPAIEGVVREHFARHRTVRLANHVVADEEIEGAGGGRLVRHGPARGRP